MTADAEQKPYISKVMGKSRRRVGDLVDTIAALAAYPDHVDASPDDHWWPV